MPDVVASRQNQLNQHKQQIVKNELQDTNGEEGILLEIHFLNYFLSLSSKMN